MPIPSDFLGLKIRWPQDYMKSTWPNSLASLSSALILKVFGWIPAFLGRRCDLIHLSQAYQSSHSAESAGGWVIIFTSSYPWALRAQSLAYSSSWITVQRTFNHVLNQLNWKSFSEKLRGANFMSFIKYSSMAILNGLSLNLLYFQFFISLAMGNMPDNLIKSDNISYMPGREL